MMTLNKQILMGGLVAGLIGCAGLAGCQAPYPRPTYGAQEDPQAAKNYPRVALVDDDNLLQKSLVVDSGGIVVTGPDGNVPMAVAVPLRSIVNNRMRLQYQFYWRDANGVELRQSGWKRFEVEPGMQFQAKGSAATLDAVDWRLEVRPAR